MTTESLLARLRATDTSLAKRTSTHIELTDSKLTAAGIDDFDQLREFLEANDGFVRRTPSQPTKSLAPLGVPRPVLAGYTGYWVPRTLLNG